MKKAGSIIILSGMSILLIGCLVFLYLLVGTEVFFKKTDNSSNINIGEYGTAGENMPEPEINGKEMKAEYIGEQAFAGGRLTADSFKVVVSDGEGQEATVTNYQCSMINNEEYRLGVGSNTFVFYYGDLSATVTVEAVDPEKYSSFAPSYVLHKKKDTGATIEGIKNGTISFADALSRVAFTGDSQIAALVSYNLLTNNSVEALIGASADYLAEQFDVVVTKAYGKDALIVHYGINSLSAQAGERAFRIAQYKELLEKLKEELPGTRIIVSGVFPVSSTIQSSRPSFGYINSYDFELLKMCMDINIEYYSNNEYMTAHQEYFSGDGLHLEPRFYSEYWLMDLIETMGL